MQKCSRSLLNCSDDIIAGSNIIIMCACNNHLSEYQMYRQVQVEAAKSNKSKCKNCKKAIEKGDQRAKMVDDRQFREYLRRNPDARGSEGDSRGYFEDGVRVISIQKYFVHLKCYRPIRPHPIQSQYFRLIGGKAADKKKFRQFFENVQEQEQEQEEEQEIEEQPSAVKKSAKKKSTQKSKSKQKK